MSTICRPWITIKGHRIYARDRGLQAFCFEVEVERPAQMKFEETKDTPIKSA